MEDDDAMGRIGQDCGAGARTREDVVLSRDVQGIDTPQRSATRRTSVSDWSMLRGSAPFNWGQAAASLKGALSTRACMAARP